MNLAEQFTQGVTIATRVRAKLLERLRKMTAGESRTYCDIKVTRADDLFVA